MPCQHTLEHQSNSVHFTLWCCTMKYSNSNCNDKKPVVNHFIVCLLRCPLKFSFACFCMGHAHFKIAMILDPMSVLWCFLEFYKKVSIFVESRKSALCVCENFQLYDGKNMFKSTTAAVGLLRLASKTDYGSILQGILCTVASRLLA